MIWWMLFLVAGGAGDIRELPQIKLGIPPLLSLRLYNPATKADSLRVLSELRTRMKRDRVDVEALRELASLLSVSASIPARQEAASALERATLLAPRDADLWVRLGALRQRQKFWSESRRALKRAGELAPRNLALNDVLAQLQLAEFQRSKHREQFEEARFYNKRALGTTNPAGIKREIRLVLMEGAASQVVDSLLTIWEFQAPHDPWCHLVRGWKDFRENRWKSAETAFRRGVGLLPPGERSAFHTLDIVAPQEQKQSSELPDSARSIRDWWHWHDPTPSDLLNPRHLEHQSRLVEAELYFGLEVKKIPGWRHAPGEMVVRYGLTADFNYFKDVRRHVGPRMFMNASYQPTALSIRFGRRGQIGADFIDFAMNGTFVRGLNRAVDEFVFAYPATSSLPFSIESKIQDLELWRFGTPGNDARIDIALALPRESWGSEALADAALITRVSVYDSLWKIIAVRQWTWGGFREDPFGRLVASWSIPAPAESLVLGIETEARAQSERAGAYATLSPLLSDGSLLLSDLGFFRDLELDDGSSPYFRDGVRALPNPGHTYLPGEAVGIGFEAYDLATDAAGLHRARITISVMRPGRRGALRYLMGAGASHRGMVFGVRGEGSTLRQIFSVEIPPLNKGDYLMEVQVTDQVAAKTVAVRGRFRVDGTGGP